jgi:hypothetical protein
MKSIVLAATGFLLFLTRAPAATEDTKAAVSAGMTVYAYIVETEATIDMCRRIDVANVASYDKVYQEYEDEIGRTVVRIGFLVAQASRRAGFDEQALLKALDTLIDKAVQTSQRMARIDPDRFALECKALPNAKIKKEKPFEPLDMMFPYEMSIIRGRF